MKKLKIGIDAKRMFLNNEGLGSYARTLIHNLLRYFPDHEYHLYSPKTAIIDLSDSCKSSNKSGPLSE